MEIAFAALIGAVPATVAAVASWKAARNSRPVANGWTVDVSEELGAIKAMLDAHVSDKRLHNTDAEGMVR